MEWWPFLIFYRGGLRIKVINNTPPEARPPTDDAANFGEAPPLRSVSLRETELPSSSSPKFASPGPIPSLSLSGTFILHATSSPSLESNFYQARCLIIIGTEGKQPSRGQELQLRGKSGAKAKPIGEKLDELLAPGEPREARKDSRGEHTKLGWWFRDFYSLRNSIVHGNTVSASEFEFQTKNARRSRFLAAVMLFDCALKEHLLQNGFGSEDDFSRSVRLVTLREHLFR